MYMDDYARAALRLVREHGHEQAERELMRQLAAAVDVGSDDEVATAQYRLDALREMRAEDAHERETFGDGSPT